MVVSCPCNRQGEADLGAVAGTGAENGIQAYGSRRTHRRRCYDQPNSGSGAGPSPSEVLWRGLYTDAWNIAFRIPNLLRDLFAEGALSSAFIPTFIRRLTQDGKEAAWVLANRVISALLIILGMLTLVFFFGARGFVYLLAAGYARIPEKFELTVQMTRIMSPFLLCVALASVSMGILNACGSFFVPAMASSAFNICCILAGIYLSPLMPQLGISSGCSHGRRGSCWGRKPVPGNGAVGARLRISLSI